MTISKDLLYYIIAILMVVSGLMILYFAVHSGLSNFYNKIGFGILGMGIIAFFARNIYYLFENPEM